MEKILWNDEVPKLLRKLKSYLGAGNREEADKIAEYISENYGLYGTLGFIYEEMHMAEKAEEFYSLLEKSGLSLAERLRKKGVS